MPRPSSIARLADQILIRSTLAPPRPTLPATHASAPPCPRAPRAVCRSSGAADVKAHPWFEALPSTFGKLDWARLASGKQPSPLLAKLQPHLEAQRAAGPEEAEQLVAQLDVAAPSGAAQDVGEQDRSVM